MKRFVFVLALVCAGTFSFNAFAKDAEPKATDAKPIVKIDAPKDKVDAKVVKPLDAKVVDVKKEEPKKVKVAPIEDKIPEVEDGAKYIQSLIEAIKAKKWWAVGAAAVFLIMLALQMLGLFVKMGKKVTWIVTGALSVVAAVLLTFSESGFSWSAFIGFLTAGPTIAWARGFVKKVFLTKEEKPAEPKEELPIKEVDTIKMEEEDKE